MELVARVDEVNAASEEISSKTLEFSQVKKIQIGTLIEISKKARELSSLVVNAMNSTENINKIKDMITNISEQTNLLASMQVLKKEKLEHMKKDLL